MDIQQAEVLCRWLETIPHSKFLVNDEFSDIIGNKYTLQPINTIKIRGIKQEDSRVLRLEIENPNWIAFPVSEYTVDARASLQFTYEIDANCEVFLLGEKVDFRVQ